MFDLDSILAVLLKYHPPSPDFEKLPVVLGPNPE